MGYILHQLRALVLTKGLTQGDLVEESYFSSWASRDGIRPFRSPEVSKTDESQNNR